MTRRRPPTLALLLLCAVASASLLEEYHLRVRPDMEGELRALSDGEFSPPLPPNMGDAHHHYRHRMMLHGQGVMAREQNSHKYGQGVVTREQNGNTRGQGVMARAQSGNKAGQGVLAREQNNSKQRQGVRGRGHTNYKQGQGVMSREQNKSTHGQGVMAREQNGNKAGQGVLSRDRDVNLGCRSPLTDWTTRQIRAMGYATYQTLVDNQIIQMAYVYKHYVDTSHGDERFADAAQTAELRRRHRDTVAFWTTADAGDDALAGDVLLLAMHGADLRDDNKLVPTLLRLFDFDSMSDILAFAARVHRIVEALPYGYDNPLLTMNAVATRSTRGRGTHGGHADPDRRVKDSIIIGEGVLRFLEEEGLGSSGPDFVHAHEFGHHLQFRLEALARRNGGGGDDDGDPRRKELLADAVGGYFLAHDNGGDLLAHEIENFDRTAFSTGDCKVGAAAHHGTPAQRRCAAAWGASRAARDDRADSAVLVPGEFVRRFAAVYPAILAGKEYACRLVLEETTSSASSSADQSGSTRRKNPFASRQS